MARPQRTASSLETCLTASRKRFCSGKSVLKGQKSSRFSVLNRPPPNYERHVPLTAVERGAMAFGSALGSLLNPYRHDLVASLGESTAQPYFIGRLRRSMLSHPTGRRILRDRPRTTSSLLRPESLQKYPSNTLAAAYLAWMQGEGVGPDTRDPVRYIDNEEEAYVMQRYRECHDLYHALTGLPVFKEGEVALKLFEFCNTGLPMTGLSMAAVGTLGRKGRRRFFGVYAPWAVRAGLNAEDLINVYWEEELGSDVEELRGRLGVEKPPDLREMRRILKDKGRQKEAEASEEHEVAA